MFKKAKLLFLVPFFLSATLSMERADNALSSEVLETYRQLSPHVKEIIRQYQAEKPNMPSFQQAVRKFSNIFTITPIHGVVRIFMQLNHEGLKEEFKEFSADPLCYQRLKRTIWFVDQVVDETSKTNDNLSPMDYLYLGFLNERSLGVIDREKTKSPNLDTQRQAYLENAYHFYKQALRSDTAHELDDVALINCYGISLRAYERKKYAKAAGYYEKRKKLLNTLEQTEDGRLLLSRAVEKQKNLGSNNPWGAFCFVPDINLAACYYYCGRLEESLNLFEALFKDKEKLKSYYDPKTGSVQIEHLICLFTFWISTNDEATQVRLKACYDRAKELLPEALRTRLTSSNWSDNAPSKPTPAKPSDKKGKKKGGKAKGKPTKGSIQPIFIESRTKEIQDLFKFLSDSHSFEKYKTEQEKHGLDPKSLEEIARLLQDLQQVRARVDLPAFQTLEIKIKTETVNKIFLHMRELQEHLKQASSAFKDSVRAKVRQSLAKQKPESSLSSRPEVNLRKDVIKTHDSKEVKVKTTGVAVEPVSQKPVEPPLKEKAESRNHILSWRANNPAQHIFINQDPLEFPDTTVELLNILSHSRNIYELGENLWSWDVNLKKIKGQKDVWAFRINQQYRIRFKEGKDGFEDVRVGDFH
jgi:tetratricopeptide (TPR) repeat protein